jgi:two-component system, NarL family, invasion response regulator UvrY
LPVVGEADTGVGGLQCVDGTPAEVLVLDLDLPDITGFEVLRRVLRNHPLLRVLVFSSCPTETFGPALLHAHPQSPL